MKKRYRKMDFIVIGVIVVIAIFALLYTNQFIHTKGNIVRVEIDGKRYNEYPLEKDFEAILMTPSGETNQFIIKEGIADMINASCPDGLCVDQKQISKDKETIVCLPNKVVIEIISEEKGQYDAVTGQ